MIDEEKKEEETSQKPEEEDTSSEDTSEETSEETSDEEQDTSQEKPDVDKLEEKNKRLYARLKKEEDKRKEAETLLAEKGKAPDPKMEEIVEAISNFEGLDAKERAILLKESKVNNLSLKEARKSEDFLLWQKGHKEKVAQEKTISPSTKQHIDKSSPEARLESFTKGEMSKEEKEEFLKGLGTVREYQRPPELK